MPEQEKDLKQMIALMERNQAEMAEHLKKIEEQCTQAELRQAPEAERELWRQRHERLMNMLQLASASLTALTARMNLADVTSADEPATAPHPQSQTGPRTQWVAVDDRWAAALALVEEEHSWSKSAPTSEDQAKTIDGTITELSMKQKSVLEHVDFFKSPEQKSFLEQAEFLSQQQAEQQPGKEYVGYFNFDRESGGVKYVSFERPLTEEELKATLENPGETERPEDRKDHQQGALVVVGP